MDEEFQNQNDSEEEGKNNISADLIRGHINTIILRTLYERDKYGYEIIEDIEAKSHGQYTLKQPTLYSALKRLESQGFINAYWKMEEASGGGRRKYYTLTDSGREITERNQSEWEYSRTVIDSLISDKNFDFSNPAPSPVDFRLLKTSTSRVRGTKNGGDDDEEDIREVKFDEDTAEAVQKNSVPSYDDNIVAGYRDDISYNEINTVETHTVNTVNETQSFYDTSTSKNNEIGSNGYNNRNDGYIENNNDYLNINDRYTNVNDGYRSGQSSTANASAVNTQSVNSVPENFDVENIGLRSRDENDTQKGYASQSNDPEQQAIYQQMQQAAQQIQQVTQQLQQAAHQQSVQDSVYFTSAESPQDAGQSAANAAPPLSTAQQTDFAQDSVSERERLEEERRRHENYMRLISEPIEQKDTVPDSESIDTEKLIYNNKPEPERDYKNLVNNLFIKTVNQPRQPEPEPAEPIPQPIQVSYEDATVKASKDGLTVNSSEYAVSGTRRKKYNRGFTLFKCSLIVGVILLFEFAISLAFKDSLGINGVSVGYPIVILALAVAEVAIFGILTTTDFGKCTRKPASHTSYLTASVVITIILILIIFVTSLLLDVNFASASDVAAKIIIPCLVAFNIPIFATIFYAFSR